MSCIFANSKYYREAKADPRDIIPPLGYQFLNSNKTKKFVDLPSSGELIYKEVYDKPHHKILSQKKTPADKIQQFLKVSQVPRKNQYLPPTLIQFMRNQYGKQMFLTISKQFVPHYKAQYSPVELSQILKNPRIQSVPHIEDYALSKFFYMCEGCDPWRIQYLHEFFNRRVIQYPVECLVINHNYFQNSQFLISSKESTIIDPPDIENIESVKSLIDQINQQNRKQDPLYSGVHFYFADFSRKQNVEYFQREINHFTLLQYYITMMSGILADGQTAVIKLCGAFKHKTVELIFLLKLMFNGKVSLCKTLGSNPFLPDSYVICQYYNKTNGAIIHKYLLENYHLLKQFSDDRLLLDPKKVLREDLHGNVKLFNEALVHKGIQVYLKEFKMNSNIEYYPSKDKIIERLPVYAKDLQPIVREMIRIPDKPAQTDIKDAKIEPNKVSDKPEGVNTANLAPRATGISAGGLFSKSKNRLNSVSSQDAKKP